MAVDQFGNPLTEEERYRLMMEQQRMGLLPGLLGGPAVDTFSGMPFAAPSYGPFGGGIGQGAYQGTMGMGTPTILPGEETINITPVDPTLAGMGTVPAGINVVEEQVIPKTGHFGISQNYGDFSPQMGMLGDMVTDQPPMVDFSVVTDDPSRPVDYSQVFTENMPTATLPAETELQIMDSPIPNVQPVQTQDTGVIPATYTETTDTGEVVPMSNENLSFFGAAPVPTSPSMNVDYSQALADAGMAPVVMSSRTSIPGRTPQAQQAEFDLVDLASDVAPPGTSDADIKDVARHAALINRLPVDTDNWTDLFTFTGQVGATIHDNVYDFMADTLGGEITDDQARQDLRDIVNNEILKDVTNSTAIGIKDLSDLDKAKMGMSGANIVWDSDQLDAMVQLNKTGYYKPSELIDSIEEVVSQVDTFKDIPAAPAKPAGPTRAELKAAAAAQRKADLAEKKAAARRTALARQALKDSQAAAARAQAASAAQAAKAIAKAKATLAAAAGRDHGGPSEREINAAIEVLSGVDSFGSGGMMTETQRAMTDVGYGGGFAEGRGDTGATGQGGWT